MMGLQDGNTRLREGGLHQAAFVPHGEQVTPRASSHDDGQCPALPLIGSFCSNTLHGGHMLNFDLGQIQGSDEDQVFVTERGQGGIAVYGPYVELPPGRYVAEFMISSDDDRYNDFYVDSIAAEVDVAIDNGTVVLARSLVHASRFRDGWAHVFQRFDLPRTATVEARVYATGRFRLNIKVDRIIRKITDGTGDFCPVLSSGSFSEEEVFQSHFDEFLSAYNNGAVVSVTREGTIVSFNKVKFYVRDIETIQVMREVFIVNEYRVRAAGRKIMIDVGMNVGLVTLAMANDPSVLEVHSFEPFSNTFDRALENFALNPELVSKIHTYPFGLSGQNLESEVFVGSSTLGTSIKGTGIGKPETIVIKDAAEILAPIIDKAESMGAEVFVKIDCEGSEFAIFKSLNQSGLISKIRGFVVEWHKWWSPECTDRDIQDVLLENGFVIFDRTNAADVFAGQFSAVRVSR
jgi:FkbM family methyltransferase